MSNQAIDWALAQPVKHSTAKFVLMVMANRADDDMICWPSTADLCQQTAQDRKTVQENLRRLREAGFIEDTGERKGATKQVIVYRLKTPEIGPVEDDLDTPIEIASDAGIGCTKEAQKRNSTNNGTGPNFPSKRPEIPTKEAQISPVTGPKTGHGTHKETTKNPQGTKNKEPAFDMLAELLNRGVGLDVARDWMAVRKKKNAPETLTALNGLAREAQKAGLSLEDAVQVCAERNWQSMDAKWLEPKAQARASPGYQTPNEKAKSFADRLTGRTRNEQPHRIIDITPSTPGELDREDVRQDAPGLRQEVYGPVGRN